MLHGYRKRHDKKITLDALDGLSLVRFGMAETNDVYGTNFSEDYRCFDVVCGGKPYCHLELGVIGRHNAMNALAACAVCWKFSIPAEAVQRALHESPRRRQASGIQGSVSRRRRV